MTELVVVITVRTVVQIKRPFIFSNNAVNQIKAAIQTSCVCPRKLAVHSDYWLQIDALST